MMQIFASSSPSTGSLPKEINRRLDVDNFFMKKTRMGASSNARNFLDKSIKAVNAQAGNIDKKFALEFVIIKAQNEKEAYQNALDSNKELLGIKGKTDFDIRIEMYDSIINAAKGLMDKK